jgi:hypothetical protein
MTDPYLIVEHPDERDDFHLAPVVLNDLDIEVPPSDQLTIPSLRVRTRQEILLQITSVLKQHVISQRSIVSNIRTENRTRPTFVELTHMFTSNLASVSASEFVSVEAVDRVALQFSSQVHSSLASAQSEVATMRAELSRVNDKFLDGFRRIDHAMVHCEQKAKQGVQHTRTLASKLWVQWRQRKLFTAWKETTARFKLRKKLLKNFFSKLFLKQQKEKFQKWSGVVTSTQINESRLKHLENEIVKALGIGQMCCSKIEEIQHK